MKNIFNILSKLTIAAATLALTGCADFEEVNTDPNAVSGLVTKPYFALNKSIIFAQQNPDTAERLFVIQWATAARQDGEDGYGTSVGGYDDQHVGASFDYMANTMKYANDAINLCNLQLEQGQLGEHETQFFGNVLAFARIWRVYAMSEFADSFGPMPTDGFQGENPEFKSLEEVYNYFYAELAEAIPAIKLDVVPDDSEAKSDPAFGYDPLKWKNFATSLWMRLAMRLSEVKPDVARAQFEKAVATGTGIAENGGNFAVQEKPGWDDLSGVMSRVWDWQTLSATMANLMTNLGGVNAADARANDEIKKKIYKNNTPEEIAAFSAKVLDSDNYLGKRFEKHWLMNTDNPTKGYFFDGIPGNIDPRAFVYYFFAGDYATRAVTGYFSYPVNEKARSTQYMYDPTATGDEKVPLTATLTDAKYSFNGLTAGIWQDQVAGKFNGIINGDDTSWGYMGTYPALAEEYRNNSAKRLFFGAWETYFLKAEAALRGWNAGISAEAAYNKGIELSFEYNGISSLYASYIDSENYNRVGTSVKFSHIAEPVNRTFSYTDGYTGKTMNITYEYPVAANVLYKGHKLNDQLTKIITQKVIANTPWLPLENWSEHRRLGLPFWEIPASSTALSEMPDWTSTSYTGAQKPGYFPQRVNFPSSLKNADPKGYESAVQLLGGKEKRVTPLWWAIGGH